MANWPRPDELSLPPMADREVINWTVGQVKKIVRILQTIFPVN